MIRERVRAGIERAKASGTKSGRRFGRPGLKDGSKGIAKIAARKAELAAGKGIRRIARDLGAGVGTVLRVKAEMTAQIAPRRDALILSRLSHFANSRMTNFRVAFVDVPYATCPALESIKVS